MVALVVLRVQGEAPRFDDHLLDPGLIGDALGLVAVEIHGEGTDMWHVDKLSRPRADGVTAGQTFWGWRDPFWATRGGLGLFLMVCLLLLILLFFGFQKFLPHRNDIAERARVNKIQMSSLEQWTPCFSVKFTLSSYVPTVPGLPIIW